MSENKYREVLQNARQREPQQEQTNQQPIASQPTVNQQPTNGPTQEVVKQNSQPKPAKRGRPPGVGKRNNPDYEQVSAYLNREVYRSVQIRLLQMNRRGEFSELVEFLLKKWLQAPSQQ